MLAAQSVPPLVQALVPLVLGLVGTLMGFGIVPASFDVSKAQAWKKKNAGTYQLGGPLLFIVGVALLVRAIWYS